MIYVDLNSWIIQDGNYNEFRVDQARESLWSSIRIRSRSHNPTSNFSNASVPVRYLVRGEVVYVDSTACVIDFGLMAYKYRNLPTIAAKGGWVEGEIALGVDPLFYFKELHARPGMPKLQYDWRIKSILLDTTAAKHEEREWRHDSDAR